MKLSSPKSSSLLLFLLSSHCLMANAEFQYKVEGKAHIRDSDQNRFPVKFPFLPEQLPVGQSQAALETVDSGTKAEISVISFSAKWDLAENISAQFSLDAIDKYDRNPTSGDRKFDVDSFILRYGTKIPALQRQTSNSFYAQVGKFAKFERQKERRTESYGLVSTAFNRFEDSGIEAGFDLNTGLYGKLSLTTGNPVFFRDPNALAGDNGTNDRRVPPENPNPSLKSGVVFFYDAEIEKFNLTGDKEIGGALGYKWQSADSSHLIDVMAFAYQRKLAKNRSLHGTFYGADLDLFDLGEISRGTEIKLPSSGTQKTEQGINLWYSHNNFSAFGQYVDQELANLGRSGYEIELSYNLDLGFPVTPVIRYSELDNDFTGPALYPAPSVWWDWKKIDYALNVDVSENLRVIVEYTDNQFLRGKQWRNNDEILVTFRWQWGNF